MILSKIQEGLRYLDDAANSFDEAGLFSASKAIDEMYALIRDILDKHIEIANDIKEEQEKGEDDESL